jgi:hypothetical protein
LSAFGSGDSPVSNRIQAAMHLAHFTGRKKRLMQEGWNNIYQQAETGQQEQGIDEFHGRSPFKVIRRQTALAI